MLKNTAAAIVGYLVMALFIMVSFSAAYITMGAERAFKPASYEPSVLWLGLSFGLGTVAAILGGFVCAAMARDRRAVILLIVLLFAIGTLAGVAKLFRDPASHPGARTTEVGNMEAMSKAIQPTWVDFLNPLIGAAGVFVGSRLRRPAPSA